MQLIGGGQHDTGSLPLKHPYHESNLISLTQSVEGKANECRRHTFSWDQGTPNQNSQLSSELNHDRGTRHAVSTSHRHVSFQYQRATGQMGKETDADKVDLMIP